MGLGVGVAVGEGATVGAGTATVGVGSTTSGSASSPPQATIANRRIVMGTARNFNAIVLYSVRAHAGLECRAPMSRSQYIRYDWI